MSRRLAAAFSDETRQVVYHRDLFACAGCGLTGQPGDGRLSLQHRISRGMGGTSRADLGSPANALLLCGSGTTGCHGWAEHHPADAGRLGWVLDRNADVRPELEPVFGRWCGTILWRQLNTDGTWTGGMPAELGHPTWLLPAPYAAPAYSQRPSPRPSRRLPR